MKLDENKELLRKYHEAWSKGDLQQLRQMLDDNCITYHLVTGEERDVSFEAEACEIWHKSFDNIQIDILQMIAEDDKVTVFWLLTSTHTREFMNIAVTHKEVRVPGMEINRIVNGKIVEIWRLSDTMSLMQQLDAL